MKALRAGRRVLEVRAEKLGAEISDSSSSLVVNDPTRVVLGFLDLLRWSKIIIYCLLALQWLREESSYNSTKAVDVLLK